MSNGSPQPLMNEVQGADLIEVLQRDIAERAEELLPLLVYRIEETRGWIPQSVTVTVKYKPGDDEKKPAVFEVSAKLSNATISTVRTVLAKGDGDRPVQLAMFVRE
jgi:hypothetical protein